MKKHKNRIIVLLCCMVAVVALAGWAIYAEWSADYEGVLTGKRYFIVAKLAVECGFS